MTPSLSICLIAFFTPAALFPVMEAISCGVVRASF
jgi:hypothetical protein